MPSVQIRYSAPGPIVKWSITLPCHGGITGSNPVRVVATLSVECSSLAVVASSSYRLAVRSQPFQGCSTGSNPVRNTSRSKSAVDGTVWGGEDVGSIPTFWTWRILVKLQPILLTSVKGL